MEDPAICAAALYRLAILARSMGVISSTWMRPMPRLGDGAAPDADLTATAAAGPSGVDAGGLRPEILEAVLVAGAGNAPAALAADGPAADGPEAEAVGLVVTGAAGAGAEVRLRLAGASPGGTALVLLGAAAAALAVAMAVRTGAATGSGHRQVRTAQPRTEGAGCQELQGGTAGSREVECTSQVVKAVGVHGKLQSNDARTVSDVMCRRC
jgi:hypothetical protein